MLETRSLTWEAYEALVQQRPDEHLELIGGEIVTKMGSYPHAYVLQMLSGFFFVYLLENALGEALVDARYRLPDDDANAYIPDFSFITKARGPKTARGPLPYMPDLAVEVQSPGQSLRWLLSQAESYLARGSRMVWLIYPEKQIVEILTADERHLLTENDTITGEPLFPGLQIPVRELFPAETS